MAVQRRRLNTQAATPEPVAESAAQVVEETLAPRAPLRATRTSERLPQHEEVHAEPRRKRRRKSTQTENPFHIPQEDIPEDLSYEWKRYSVIGEEQHFYLGQLREQGWEPVPAKRHANWFPPGYNEPHIIRGGLILMDRPKECTDEARVEDRQLARRQVREAEQRLGMTPKDTLERQKPSIVKEIGRMVPQIEE